MWGGGTIAAFDLQPEDGQTATGHIAVHADTVYTDGQYGWLTESERDDFGISQTGGSEVPQPYEDSIFASGRWRFPRRTSQRDVRSDMLF